MLSTPDKTRLKLVTLDLDDTLWPLGPVIVDAECALLEWLREHAPPLVLAHDRESLREHRRRLMTERPEVAHDIGLVRRLSLVGVLVELGYPPGRAESLADGAMAVFLEHRNRVEPFPDALPALRRLAARFRLVSVTNGNADPERTPLAGVFAHRVTAAAAGASKPDPAVFRLAMELCGCAPEECLHVGDEPYLDVEAARALGMGAVWMDRGARVWPEGLAPPILRVSDLNRLAHWLEAPAGQGGPLSDGGCNGV